MPKRPSREESHQAGGIVVRRDGGVRVLVVTARRKRRRWIFPKGRVEPGEHPADAARREVAEEAGVHATVASSAGTVRYTTRAGRVRVDYFLLEYRGAAPAPGEDRQLRWCAVEDAMQLLTFASARRILLEAHPRIVARTQRPAAKSATKRPTTRPAKKAATRPARRAPTRVSAPASRSGTRDRR